jgi:hypothetical protein
VASQPDADALGDQQRRRAHEAETTGPGPSTDWRRLVPILDLTPCSVSLAWWPQDTALVAGLAAVADEVRATMAET